MCRSAFAFKRIRQALAGQSHQQLDDVLVFAENIGLLL
jgi:hypothetical protein